MGGHIIHIVHVQAGREDGGGGRGGLGGWMEQHSKGQEKYCFEVKNLW